jgi:heme/copper-type cytochrome/quinol oxidase subunit 3
MNKKLIFMAITTLVIVQTSTAQNLDLQSPANNLKQQIVAIFPYVVGIIFVVVALINLGHFTKEGGDWKKGLFNILLYVIVVGIIASLYKYVSSVSL